MTVCTWNLLVFLSLITHTISQYRISQDTNIAFMKTKTVFKIKIKLREVAPRPGFGPGSCGRQPHILDRTILPGHFSAATIHGNGLIKLFLKSIAQVPDKPLITQHTQAVRLDEDACSRKLVNRHYTDEVDDYPYDYEEFMVPSEVATHAPHC